MKSRNSAIEVIATFALSILAGAALFAFADYATLGVVV